MKPEGWHSVTVVDETGRRGECSVCGPDVDLRRRERRGRVEWSCMRKHRSYSRPWRPGHRKFNSGTCVECGFVAVHSSQIDVHHRDGDHGNNDPTNLVSLCANCHRLWHAMGVAGMEIADEMRQRGEAVIECEKPYLRSVS